MYRDQYGIIGQLQDNGFIEGGDSVNWQGHWHYVTGLMGNHFSKTFEVSFGGWVRHPHRHKTNNGFGAYYRNPWTGVISRDQMTGIIGGIIATNDYYAAIRHCLHRACSLFIFAYNSIHNGVKPSEAKRKLPDITGPNIWAIELRMFGVFSWLFWPLLVVLDLHLLVDTIWMNKRTDNDPISYVLKFLISCEHVPTPTTYLCRKVLDFGKVKDKLRAYWIGWRGGEEIVPFYEKKLDKLA